MRGSPGADQRCAREELGVAALSEQANYEQQYYGAQQGDEQRAEAEIVLIDGAGAEQRG
jgi:hypothetical protein